MFAPNRDYTLTDIKNNIMTTTGIIVTEKRKGFATRIEVDSQKYNEDLMYQDVTLDTAYSNHIKESFDRMFKDSLEALEEIKLVKKEVA